MTSNGGAVVRWMAISAAVLAAASVLIAAKPAQAPQAGGQKTAVQVFKNIQVLKDIPADQLIPSMQFITNSLGVECDFCHVEGAFDKDDKDEKKIARKMMAMMITINQENFESKKMVTCNSCHRGSPHPQAIPEITAEARKPVNTEEMEKEHHAGHMQMAPADPVIDAYIKAVGGEAAIAKLKSVVEKASFTMGPNTVSVDVYEQTPDRRVTIAHMPNGSESVTAYNGTDGWLTFPKRPVRFMNADEQAAAKMDAEFLVPSDPRKAFAELKSVPDGKIDGKDVKVVVARNPGFAPTKLYFDARTGLLVRIVRDANTALGLNPTQVDIGEYREQDGAKIPYEWTIARPFSRFTMKVQSVEVDATIPQERFAKPAEQPGH